MDIEARQLALQYLDRSKRAETQSAALLKEARKVNMAASQRPSDALLSRRAVLARDAYNARMNAEVGRTMAAYALLAEREGTKAVSAQEAMRRVKDAKQKDVLVEEAKGGQIRRNIMLQAAAAAEKALQYAPGLPKNIVGNRTESAGAAQATVGASGIFRPKKYTTVQGSFFPEDIRAAASSFKGMDLGCMSCEWNTQLGDAIEQDAARVQTAAKDMALVTAAQEPGAAALVQQADGLIAQLRQRYMQEMPTGEHPWVHMAIAAVATFTLIKVLK